MSVRLDARNRPEPDILATNTPYDPYRAWFAPEDVLLVVEVVSPESAHRDRTVELRVYAEAGIPRYRCVEEEAGAPVTHVYGLDEPARAYAPARLFREVLKRPLPFELDLDLVGLPPRGEPEAGGIRSSPRNGAGPPAPVAVPGGEDRPTQPSSPESGPSSPRSCQKPARTFPWDSGSRRAFAGERGGQAPSRGASYSAAGTRTALPLLETTSMVSWSSLTRLTEAVRDLRASLALTAVRAPGTAGT